MSESEGIFEGLGVSTE